MAKTKTKDNKPIQESLGFDNQESTDDLTPTFVLKIHDGHLSDLKIPSVANLLTAFGKILDIEDTTFGTIQEGSTTIALNVPKDYTNIAIQNIKKSTIKNKDQYERIRKELGKYGYDNAEISYGFFRNNQYFPEQVLTKVPSPEIEQPFTQEESYDGKLSRLQLGKDQSDHVTIILNDNTEIPASCSHKVLEQLQPYFNTTTLLRFQGTATYVYKSSSTEIIRKKFQIENFFIVDNMDIEDWIDGFRECGASDWNQFEDPIEAWLEERHN